MVETGGIRSDSSESLCVVNAQGSSPYFLVCEHASNYMPEEFAGLGLNADDLQAHIAWDPGAVEVARGLAAALDATLVEARLSRLLIDCNRPLDAHDLIPMVSELTQIPGNQNLDAAQRETRITLSHQPFHDCIEQLLEQRRARGQESRIITIHSFTPVYKGVSRPWEIGIIHDDDARLAAPMIAQLALDPQINVGVNEPYSPDDRVYYTLECHARNRDGLCAMVEIRNNEINDADGQKRWADRLAQVLRSVDQQLMEG